MPVDTPSREYNKYVAKWKRCRDTFDGQDAVKAERTNYLPMLGGQPIDVGQAGVTSNTVYDAYLYRAMFFNAVAPTVVALTGAAFLKPMTKNGVPETIDRKLFQDVTLTGRTLEQFARDMVGQVLHPGRYGVLVDMPATPVPATTARPYWIAYRAEDIINYQTAVVNGEKVVTMVVLREREDRPNAEDPFVPETVIRYRVLQIVGGVYTVTIWRQDPEDKNKFIAEAPLTPVRRALPLPFIPFVFVGPEGTEPDISDPPLMALVDVNLSHYLTMADLEWGSHWTALPTPVITGSSSDSPVYVGSTKALMIPEPGAKAEYLEFSGTGLGALRENDKAKREMMANLGGRMLEQTGPAETATAVRIHHSGETASMLTIALACSQALSRCTQWSLWWMGTDTDVNKDATIELSTDFFPVKMTPDELSKLMMSWQAGAISFEVFFHALQEGGIYPPGTTIEDEKARLESEQAEADARNEEMMKRQAELGSGGLPELED